MPEGRRPSIAMRKLHWDAIKHPAAMANTIWADLGREGMNIELDFADFEQTFAEPSNAVGVKKEKKEEEKPKTIQVIDPKKAYNIGIGLARFKMTHEGIRKAILEMNESALTEEKLDALIKFAPADKEIQEIKAHLQEYDKLGDAEKFFLKMSSIKRYTERLQMSLFKLQFQQIVRNLEVQLETLEKARLDVQNCVHLKTVFKIILAFGNYMNSNSRLGQASGFKIETLTKVKGSKSADNKISLLEYLVKYTQKHCPEVADFALQIVSANDASKIDPEGVKADARGLTAQIQNLEREIRVQEVIEVKRQERIIKKRAADERKLPEQLEAEAKAREQGFNEDADLDDDDRFLPVMQAFFIDAKDTVTQLEDRLRKLEEENKAIVKYYGGADDMGVDRFFSILSQFVSDFTAAKNVLAELEKKQAQKEKREKDEIERKAKKEAEKKAKEAAVIEDMHVDETLANSEGQTDEAMIDRRRADSIFIPTEDDFKEADMREPTNENLNDDMLDDET